MDALSLSDLPRKPQVAIFGNILFRARAHPRKVCKEWAATLDDPDQWQDASEPEKHAALLIACERGSAEAARWVTAVFGLAKYAKRCRGNALHVARESGHLAAAQRPATTSGRGAREAGECDDSAQRSACKLLGVARWLAVEFASGPYGARAGNNYALRAACSGGHLAVAQWLVAKFELGIHDARAGENHALLLVCENGHLNVAQWLTAEFVLDRIDARAEENYALRLACENGHLEVAKWLVAEFGLKPADARTYDNSALCGACKRGHLAVVQWLVAEFALGADDVHSDDDYAARAAAENGHHHVAEWLATEFGASRENP